jgi:hypothetical protein
MPRTRRIAHERDAYVVLSYPAVENVTPQKSTNKNSILSKYNEDWKRW